jgi:hypothetical protein
MWLHRVPRSERFCLATALSRSSLFAKRRGNDAPLRCRYSSVSSRDSAVRSVLQRRMAFPGVGSCYSAYPGMFVLCILFASTRSTCCCFTTSTLLPPSRDSAHPLVCRSQSRRTHELHQAAMPALVIPSRFIATWELVSAAPDLWDLSACL